MKKSNTALIMEPFLEGMKDGGAKVELLYVKRLDIRPCTGEFHCWDVPSGKCIVKDDMGDLIPKMKRADVWVFGIPVYVPMPGEMQNLLNRMMPLLESRIVIQGRRMLPHKRDDVRVKIVSLVSTCGYWELANFDELVCSMKRVADVWEAEFARPILRPHSDTLRRMLGESHEADDILTSARAAGRQLVEEGKIREKSARTVERPLMSFKDFTDRFEKAD